MVQAADVALSPGQIAGDVNADPEKMQDSSPGDKNQEGGEEKTPANERIRGLIEEKKQLEARMTEQETEHSRRMDELEQALHEQRQQPPVTSTGNGRKTARDRVKERFDLDDAGVDDLIGLAQEVTDQRISPFAGLVLTQYEERDIETFIAKKLAGDETLFNKHKPAAKRYMDRTRNEGRNATWGEAWMQVVDLSEVAEAVAQRKEMEKRRKGAGEVLRSGPDHERGESDAIPSEWQDISTELDRAAKRGD